jgi:hypothetical protein
LRATAAALATGLTWVRRPCAKKPLFLPAQDSHGSAITSKAAVAVALGAILRAT